MSRIENYRDGKDCRQREMWDYEDIAEYGKIPDEKAQQLIVLANKYCGNIGYADIRKEDFIEFISIVQAECDSRRLQDQANEVTIEYAKKNYTQGWLTSVISSAIALLSR